MRARFDAVCWAPRRTASALYPNPTVAGCARCSVGYSLLIKEEKMIKVP
jgi:hypothetical protein